MHHHLITEQLIDCFGATTHELVLDDDGTVSVRFVHGGHTDACGVRAIMITAGVETTSAEEWSGRLAVEMAATTELDRAVTERLAKHDLRYTTGRRQIVSGLRRAGGPVTLPELLQIQSDLAQSSAYRNLSLMEEAGVVRRLVHRGDHAHYELAEELTEHHHHLICESCGIVLDVTFTAATERNLDKAFESVAEAQGFVPRHHVIDVYGRCERCA
jgi:Fe2+ or Zn2+ uptake regulation protein